MSASLAFLVRNALVWAGLTAIGVVIRRAVQVHLERCVGHRYWLLARWHEPFLILQIAPDIVVSIAGGFRIRAPHGLSPTMFDPIDVHVHRHDRQA